MGAEIDRLEVQVEAQATKANNQLDKLVTKLDRVSGALSNLNGGGLIGLSNGVTKFAQASAQLSNVKTADFTRLTKNIDKLVGLNTQQIYGVASSMKTLSTAINSLSGVSQSSLQVAEVAKSISKLGGANVQRAITNLPALATAMNNLMANRTREYSDKLKVDADKCIGCAKCIKICPTENIIMTDNKAQGKDDVRYAIGV